MQKPSGKPVSHLPALPFGHSTVYPIAASVELRHRRENIAGDKSTSTLPHTITPYLAVRDAVRAIEFYKKAFGATVSIRISEASGRVGHASLKFGDSEVFLSDEYPEIGVSSPQTVGGTTFALYIYVDDVDKVTEQAVAAGAQLLREVQDEPDGDRRGRLRDPFGHEWMVATRKEVLSTEQLRKRFAPAGYKVE